MNDYLKFKYVAKIIICILVVASMLVLVDMDKTRPYLKESLTSKYRYLSFRYYLLTGFDVNAVGSDGFTALMTAASLCARDYVYMLLEAGADPNMVDNSGGYSALMLIGSNGTSDAAYIAKILIEYGANHHLVAKDGTTALNNAIKTGDKELIDFINGLYTK